MKKLLSLTLVTLLCAAAAIAQPGPRPNMSGPTPIHNGIWWEAKSGLYKEAFIGGYKLGAEKTAGHAVDVNKFPISELTDGLDHFYKDFRNRNIMLPDALKYIEDELRGVDDSILKTELLALRAAAAPPPQD